MKPKSYLVFSLMLVITLPSAMERLYVPGTIFSKMEFRGKINCNKQKRCKLTLTTTAT
jgi:hypothetical protein